MRRRALLTALGASVATAGCVVGYTDSDSSDGNDDTDGEIETLTLAEQGTPPTICSEELKPDGILAIDDPSFGPPTEWPDDPDGYRPLNDQSTVIGVEDGGEARAYPLTILNVHEIVNDTLGRPVIVTRCSTCRGCCGCPRGSTLRPQKRKIECSPIAKTVSATTGIWSCTTTGPARTGHKCWRRRSVDRRPNSVSMFTPEPPRRGASGSPSTRTGTSCFRHRSPKLWIHRYRSEPSPKRTRRSRSPLEHREARTETPRRPVRKNDVDTTSSVGFMCV